MAKLLTYFRSFAISLLLLNSCGVNTGNPGNTFNRGYQVQPGTTLSLNMNSLSSGTFLFRASALRLVPVGETLGSAKVVNVNLLGKPIIRTGQLINLFSKEDLASGTYDRIVFIVDGSTIPTFIDGEQQEYNVAIAPYKYYGNSQTDSSSNVVLITMSFLDQPFVVTAKTSQQWALKADVSSNLKGFDQASEVVRAYYQDKGQSDYLYSFDPDATADVTRVLIEASPSESMSPEITPPSIPTPSTSLPKDGTLYILTLDITTKNNQITYIQNCFYLGDVPPAVYNLDIDCNDAYSTSFIKVTPNLQIFDYFISNGGVFTYVVRRGDDKSLVYASGTNIIGDKTLSIVIP